MKGLGYKDTLKSEEMRRGEGWKVRKDRDAVN